MGLDAILFVLVLGAARVVRQEIRVREAHEALARTQEMQQRLVAVVSHDLRNPLSGILTAAWALAPPTSPTTRSGRRAASPPPAGAWSGSSAICSTGAAPRRARRSRSTCARGTCTTSARVADDLSDPRSHRIELVREGDTVAEFDPDRMEQVVANLLSNALKYGDPSGRRIGAVGEEGAVRVEVSDDGPGLDPAIRAGIFEPFQRAPAATPARDERRPRALRRADAQRGAGCAGERRVRAGAGTTFVVRVRRAAPVEVRPA